MIEIGPELAKTIQYICGGLGTIIVVWIIFR
jgi:hypothetical protein